MPTSDFPFQRLAGYAIPSQPGAEWREEQDHDVRERIEDALSAVAEYLSTLRELIPTSAAAPLVSIERRRRCVDLCYSDGHFFEPHFRFRPEGAYRVIVGGERFLGSWSQGVGIFLRDLQADGKHFLTAYVYRLARIGVLESLVMGYADDAVDVWTNASHPTNGGFQGSEPVSWSQLPLLS